MIEILIGVEVVVAVLLTVLNAREMFFLRSLISEMPEGSNLWLLRAIIVGQVYLTFVGIYLLGLSALSVLLGINISQEFTWIRPINGLIFLGIISGPYYIGREMRKGGQKENGINRN